MSKTDKYSPSREPGKEHIPKYPRCFTIVRFLQLILAVVLLGLTAYAITVIPWSGNAMMIFTAIATIISSIYILVARFGPPKAYNYWAILALDLLMMVFWLVSFALMAVAAARLFAAAAYLAAYNNGYFGYDYYSGSPYASTIADVSASYTKSKTKTSSSSSSYSGSYDGIDIANSSTSDLEDVALFWGAIAAVSAALGAIQFLLFLISMSIHSCAIHRHRKAGLHCKPGVAATPVAPTNNPEVGYVPPPQQAAAPPQAMYGQQYPVDQQQQQMPPMTQQQQQVYGAPPMMHQQDPNAMYAGQQGGMVSPVNPQTTGGSYVQGAPVSFDGSQQQQHHELQQQPHYTGSSTVGSSGPVYETHGESKA